MKWRLQGSTVLGCDRFYGSRYSLRCELFDASRCSSSVKWRLHGSTVLGRDRFHGVQYSPRCELFDGSRCSSSSGSQHVNLYLIFVVGRKVGEFSSAHALPSLVLKLLKM